MNAHVVLAIFRRNILSYFSNPTGYVFIVVFVLMSSAFAFCNNDFFNANLANLDQLSRWLPLVLLVFIPAITMSIWADERRQGTDELLLTIPAADFDVVMGKYLAAVAIYAVTLGYSFIVNWIVLRMLGRPDVGLLLGAYFGYFLLGLAMLAIGMTASFLTGNLTVGFILGALFNAIWFGAAMAADQLSGAWRLSISEQLRDFSRGVISLGNVSYFLAIVALMLYMCMVLIGRRHWRGGSETMVMVAHYGIRLLAVLLVVIGVNIFLTRHDQLRADVTTERINSLSPKTVEQLTSKLEVDRPVVIEYFVSPRVPEGYQQSRLNLLSTLREIRAINPDKIRVIGHEVELYGDEANRAEQQFGIRPVPVQSRSQGAFTRDEIFLGVAITCGVEKVVIPFMDRGMSVEYEVVRSIGTVSQKKRKRVGVLMTDAKLYGQFDMSTGMPPRNEKIIEELEKQYDVSQVDPSEPITQRYDVLLAVQPSSLNPLQMTNFIDAVKSGQPTAIFEDPFPWLAQDIPGTMAQKMPPQMGGPFGMQQQQRPEPKGNIRQLWQLLGVDFSGDNVVGQDYNPIPKARSFVNTNWVFVDKGCGAEEPFDTKSEITNRLEQLLFLYPGAVRGLNDTTLTFEPLVTTGDATNIVNAESIIERTPFGPPRFNQDLQRMRRPSNEAKYMAARITGKPRTSSLPMFDQEPKQKGEQADDHDHDHDGHDHAKDDHDHAQADDKAKSGKEKEGGATKNDDKNDDKAAKAAPVEKKDPEINVVLVCDIDCMFSAFFEIRERGDDPDREFDLRFDNVPFVLNVLDVLANDDSLVQIRTRRPTHRTLTAITDATEQAKEKADEANRSFENTFTKDRDAAQKRFNDRIEKVEKSEDMNSQQKMIRILTEREAGQRELDQAIERAKRKRDEQLKTADRDSQREINKVKARYMFWALVLPPFPPILVGLVVLLVRVTQEREGVSKARLR